MRKILLGLVFVLPLLAFMSCSSSTEYFETKNIQLIGENHTQTSGAYYYNYTDISMSISGMDGIYMYNLTYKVAMFRDWDDVEVSFGDSSKEKYLSGSVEFSSNDTYIELVDSKYNKKVRYRLENNKWILTFRGMVLDNLSAMHPYPEVMKIK